MRCWLSAISLCLLCAVAAAAVAETAAQCSPLPPDGIVAGWFRQGEPRSFGPGNLWEYIDGAADLFLAYGFRRLETAQYARDGDQDSLITVDIYDMGAPLRAFGIFRSEQPQHRDAVSLGAQGYVSEGLAAFCRGVAYVKVSVLSEDDIPAARALATETDKRLCGTDGLPAEFDLLPALGRRPDSERYIAKDALGHKSLTHVISADYRIGENTATVYLALMSREQATQAWRKLFDFEKRAGKGAVRISDVGAECFAAQDSSYGEVVVARADDTLIIAASQAADRPSLTNLVAETIGKLAANGGQAGLRLGSASPHPERSRGAAR